MNDLLKIERRKGASRSCPKCDTGIKYTVFNVHDAPMPYFYSTSGKAILLRQSDKNKISAMMQQVGEDEEKLRQLCEQLLSSSPSAPDGTKFDLWANLRCPYCGYEFPYNYGVRSIIRRIMDTKIVVVDGTVILTDRPEDYYKVQVE